MSKWGDDMKKQKNGFTLIELVVVIAVLGILAALGIMRISDSIASARGSKVVGDLRTLDSAITIYNTTSATALTSLDQLADNEIATVPTPPKGDFTVVTTAGTEKAYDAATYNADAYTYDATTQRALFCGHPVEYYLAGDATAKTFADYASDIDTIMKTAVTTANSMDSTVNGSTRVKNVLAALKAQNIDSSVLGSSWRYVKANNTIYYTSTDISALTNGTSVNVIAYNGNNGTYSVYTSQVKTQTYSGVNNNQPYNIINTDNGTIKLATSTSTNLTYDEALAIYNSL